MLPALERPAARQAVSLLELDPGLADGLDGDELHLAQRAALIPAFDLPAGELRIDAVRDAPEVAGHGWGVYVVRGVILNHLDLRERTCSRLFGAGDLILLDGPLEESVPAVMRWTVRQEAQVAVLDDRLLAAGRRWPALMRAVHERAALVARQGFVDRAISQLPRAEDRLLACFWTIADRRGRVRADGVWVEVPLTHDELGTLVGARRSTVSLALRRLAEAGLARPERGGWLLAHGSLDSFWSAGPQARAARG